MVVEKQLTDATISEPANGRGVMQAVDLDLECLGCASVREAFTIHDAGSMRRKRHRPRPAERCQMVQATMRARTSQISAAPMVRNAASRASGEERRHSLTILSASALTASASL